MSPNYLDIEYNFDANTIIVIDNSRKISKETDLNLNEVDSITFANDYLQIKWKISAAIVREHYGEKSGHIVCWKKQNKGWLEISDSSSNYRETFDLKKNASLKLVFFRKIKQTFDEKDENVKNTNEQNDDNFLYFLRLRNSLNECYSNSILQVFLSLGNPFFNTVFI